MVGVKMSYCPGDILFFGKAAGNIGDVLIQDWTGSELVHCAVAVSAAQKIEALTHSVVITPIQERVVAASWSFNAPTGNLNNGLVWLQSQVGQMYGWGDIVDAVLWKFEHGIAIDDGHFDCSGLCLEFLIKCGGVPALAKVTNPHIYTPATLAGLLGVKA